MSETNRGLKAATGDDFSIAEAIGGIRGLIESIAPAFVFIVLFQVTKDLNLSLIASLAVAGVAVVIRLVQGTALTQALAGVFGVAIGAYWAYRTGAPQDYFLPGLITNAAYLLAFLISLAVRWPLIGVGVALLRGEGTAWRQAPSLRKRYYAATWLWVGLFAVRLLVQVPLYLAGDSGVSALGTARLIMGTPLFGLVLLFTWMLVRTPKSDFPQEDPNEQAESTPAPQSATDQ